VGVKTVVIPTLEELQRVDTSHDLILSLTQDQEIIQFNKESERFTGFHRDEVLHKKLTDILVPTETASEWSSLLVLIEQNMWIDNFILPIKTKTNQVRMIAWTGFLVKDEQGVAKDICIFGKPIKTELQRPPEGIPSKDKPPKATPVLQEKEPLVDQDVQKTSPSSISQEIPYPQKTEQKSPANVPEPLPSSIPPNTPVLQKKEHQGDQDVQKASPSTDTEKVPPPQEKEAKVPLNVQKPVPSSTVQEAPTPQEKEHLKKHGTRKMIFARGEKKAQDEPLPVPLGKPPVAVEQKQPTATSEFQEKQSGVSSQKLDAILQSLTNLTQKYETALSRIAELEKKEETIEKKQKHPEASPKPQKDLTDSSKKNQPSVKPSKTEDTPPPEETHHTFFSDPFGFKRQHSELDIKRKQLELRMKQLESYETRLMKEKDTFHARVAEFSKWQEKLIGLEAEIEKRRQELIQQENTVLEQRPQRIVSQQPTSPIQTRQKNIGGDVPPCDDETLEKIPQSAAIIQRGIFKQINTPFLELLGYSMEEIIEKSYFDFIAVEGLADVEKYYLDRLKGDNVSVYQTVFSAKDNTKIPAEVNIKQTVYNGEKAEIAIITCVELQSS
jgi:PAS domain S-box-containing protein